MVDNKRRTNKGAVMLRAKLEPKGAKAAFARALEIKQDLVSRWISGERLPSPKQRARIEDEYGISWRLWDAEVSERRRAA